MTRQSSVKKRSQAPSTTTRGGSPKTKSRKTTTPSASSGRESFYAIRKKSGSILYQNVQYEHIKEVVEKFKVALSAFSKVKFAGASFRQSKSDPERSDVQCCFESVSGGKLEVRERYQKNPFELGNISGNIYVPILDAQITGTDWKPVSHNSTVVTTRSAEEIVAEFFESVPYNAEIQSFRLAMEDKLCLFGLSRERSSTIPCVFSHHDCWRSTLTEDRLSQKLLMNVQAGIAYRADNAHRPAEEDDEFMAIAWRQTREGKKKQDEVAHCILNIPLGEDLGIQIPSILSDGQEDLSSNLNDVSANMAPEGYVVDLHIGKAGMKTQLGHH